MITMTCLILWMPAGALAGFCCVPASVERAEKETTAAMAAAERPAARSDFRRTRQTDRVVRAEHVLGIDLAFHGLEPAVGRAAQEPLTALPPLGEVEVVP